MNQFNQSQKIIPKKWFGQNFLVDPNIRQKIIDETNLSADKILFEIGPGKGYLTEKLLPLVKKTIAIEIDGELVEYLNNKFENSSLKVINQDILNFNYNDYLDLISLNNVIIGNLPYNISSQILFKLTEISDRFSESVVMLQKDFAARLLAKPNTKKYNALTVILNYYFDIKKLFDVSPNCFDPKPKVESMVVKLIGKKEKTELDTEKFNKFVHNCFANKRKIIINSLKNNCEIDENRIKEIFKQLDIDKNSRAEQLSLDTFIDLFILYNQN